MFEFRKDVFQCLNIYTPTSQFFSHIDSKAHVVVWMSMSQSLKYLDTWFPETGIREWATTVKDLTMLAFFIFFCERLWDSELEKKLYTVK